MKSRHRRLHGGVIQGGEQARVLTWTRLNTGVRARTTGFLFPIPEPAFGGLVTGLWALNAADKAAVVLPKKVLNVILKLEEDLVKVWPVRDLIIWHQQQKVKT